MSKDRDERSSVQFMGNDLSDVKPTAVVNFVGQNYRYKFQIPHDDGSELIHYTGQKILPIGD